MTRLWIFPAMVAGSWLLGACNLYTGSRDDPGVPWPYPLDAGGFPDGIVSPPDSPTGPGSFGDRWLAFDSDRGSFNRDIWLIRGDGSQLTRLTTEPSIEKDPAFSSDGTTLAFASDRSGSMQIHAMDLVNGSVRQLTAMPGGADQPSWSSDNRLIAFHSGLSVYMIFSGGGTPRLLATGLDSLNSYQFPSLSHDGKEVIFSRSNEIDARNIATGAQRYIVQNWTTIEETPALSPSGNLVAFSVICGVKAIAVTPYAGYAPDPCATERATPLSAFPSRRPSWVTDSALAFEQMKATGNSVITLVQMPGGAMRDIIGPPGDHHDPNWAPPGFEPRQ